MSSKSEPNSERLTDPRLGSVLGDRYRIETLLDEGAMGQVYRGEHIHMRKRVAIKILRRELTRVPEVLARFEREAMAAANISHQHVAAATDFGKLDDGSVYLVLEYVEGRTLRAELSRGALSVHRALRIGRQIADALTAAHELEIVHRDLKPENVMLVEHGANQDYVKVLDFGVAKVPVDIADSRPQASDSGSLITKAGMIFGTPDYMSPEQALGQSVDYRADLYSLGVVLYEMLAGVRPFRGDQELGVLGQQLSKGAPTISQRAPSVKVPRKVETFVRSLMVNEVSERVASAHVAKNELSSLLRSVPDDPLPAQAGAPEGPGQGAPVLDTTREAGPPFAQGASPGSARRLPSARRILVAAGGRVRRFFRWLTAQKNRLPEPLSLLPLWVVVLVPLVFLSGVSAIVWALGAGPDQVAGFHTSNQAGPSPAEVEQALAGGVAPVRTLSEKYPKDARVRLAMARAFAQAEDFGAAVRQLERLLQDEPSYAEHDYVAEILQKAVQLPASEAQTMKLLRGVMGAHGADISYDLVVTEGVKPRVAKSARAWLKTRAFERNSSPEASVAAALALAPSCTVRAALVKRAENAGDERSLVWLRKFASGKGCAAGEPKPCNACLKGSAELASAIRALSAASK